MQITLVNLVWKGEKSDSNTSRGKCIIKAGLFVVCLRLGDRSGCLNGVWKVELENKRLKIKN